MNDDLVDSPSTTVPRNRFRPPLAVGVEVPSAAVRWHRDIGDDIVVERIRESGLRESIRARAELRSHSVTPSNLLVALEIDALVSTDAATARAALVEAGESPNGGTTFRYVGTVNGLLSLITDAYTTEVADGFIVHAIDGVSTTSALTGRLFPLLVTTTAAG
ncbi:MAG: hypothetical protein U5O16_23975 [Rhodococcus sp. (in: high G+C Gram-positive bacteria)]|uniref:hypothetical protein n=1 Tax=Rhodococcus sp. TaxID=1831 RepID=UPI002AD9E492|nr:hypothetical protein [Rhodococcus sp. (in: high G+C Gram-positive bacteria)]